MATIESEQQGINSESLHKIRLVNCKVWSVISNSNYQKWEHINFHTLSMFLLLSNVLFCSRRAPSVLRLSHVQLSPHFIMSATILFNILRWCTLTLNWNKTTKNRLPLKTACENVKMWDFMVFVGSIIFRIFKQYSNHQWCVKLSICPESRYLESTRRSFIDTHKTVGGQARSWFAHRMVI